MPGLYIHIPFCKQACHYCNFHFSTSLKYKKELLAAIAKEAILRKQYLSDTTLGSIYLGGGTPSLLSVAELDSLFEVIFRYYKVAADAEITLEANPDDLSLDKLKALASSPVNRLSIGIQSFFDEDLQFMNRAHNAAESKACIENARSLGFNDLTIDLIYGSPTTSEKNWQYNLDTVLNYKIPHLSCYCLTVEPRTALDHFVRSGKYPAVDEEQAASQFESLMQRAKAEGYIHYEISNFALPGHYARHNSNYWKGESYLGIGPSAHSFDGSNRQWNLANNTQYQQIIGSSQSASQLLSNGLYEEEHLSSDQRYNEYIMTGLRTIWGCEVSKIESFGNQYLELFLKSGQSWVNSGELCIDKNRYFLSDSGRLLADRIAMDLFAAD